MATKKTVDAPTPADAVIPDPQPPVTVDDPDPFALPSELLTLGRDGSATIHLGGTDMRVPPLTVGQIRQVFVLDDEHPMGGTPGDHESAVANGRWLEGLAKICDVELPTLDDLPVWTLRPHLRVTLSKHWLTIPFR